MTDISGKSMEEIYREEARRYKESIEKERLYDKSMTVTMPTQEFDRLQKLALSAHTDKLSVEKLQEHLLPYKKETVQKIIDEKMQLVTADEFLKLHKESLTAIRENDKLQEQLNTAKKALTEEIESIEKYLDKYGMSSYGANTRQAYLEGLKKALAAIGGDDDENRL